CVLMAKHGLVTWGESAEACYASTINAIRCAAEALLDKADRRRIFSAAEVPPVNLGELLPVLRGAISKRQHAVLHVDLSPPARECASRPDVQQLATPGPAFPDHPGPPQPRPPGVAHTSHIPPA